MRSHRYALAFGSTLVIAGAAHAQSFGNINQERSVFALAHVDHCGPGVITDLTESTAAGVFIESASAFHGCAVAQAEGGADQRSFIGNAFVTAEGSAASIAFSGAPTSAQAVGESALRLQFRVDDAHRFRLRGLIAAAGGGPGQQFSGVEVILASANSPGGIIASHRIMPPASGHGVSDSFHDAGVLEPGVYVLRVHADSVIDANVTSLTNTPLSGESSYILSFELPADCEADWNQDGHLNTGDVLAYLNDYRRVQHGLHPIYANPDLAEPLGVLNTADVIAFLNLFTGGCP